MPGGADARASRRSRSTTFASRPRPPKLALHGRRRRSGSDTGRRIGGGSPRPHSDCAGVDSLNLAVAAGIALEQPDTGHARGSAVYSPRQSRREPQDHQTARGRHTCRVRLRTQDPRAQQALLPVQSLADLDLRLLHRAGSAHVRSLRPRLRLPDGAVARRRDASAPASPALRGALPGRRAEAVHHPLHRRSAESAVPPRLLHVRLERGDHVRRAQHRRSGDRDRHRRSGISRSEIYRVRLLPDRRIDLAARRPRTAAACESLDQRARATSGGIFTDRSGRCAWRSPRCG